jgi:hypothetical protein
MDAAPGADVRLEPRADGRGVSTRRGAIRLISRAPSGNLLARTARLVEEGTGKFDRLRVRGP